MIEIVAYRTEWPLEFQQIAKSLRMTLGEIALRIDHIGSTSVPGLDAKDRIDIQVTVRALEPNVQQMLESIGYIRNSNISSDHIPAGCEGEESKWVKWFFAPPKMSRPINLHVRIAGNPNQRYPLLFRDYLRTHPEAAGTYARIKKSLARFHANDVDAYYDVKDPVCDLIIQAAEAWAKCTCWQPGDSDA